MKEDFRSLDIMAIKTKFSQNDITYLDSLYRKYVGPRIVDWSCGICAQEAINQLKKIKIKYEN